MAISPYIKKLINSEDPAKTKNMQEESFSPEESLQVIQTMIEKTKSKVVDNSFYFLLWGWLVFIASIGQFIVDRNSCILRFIWICICTNGLAELLYILYAVVCCGMFCYGPGTQIYSSCMGSHCILGTCCDFNFYVF